MEADHRGASNGIPDVDRGKDKGHVHDDPVGRHAVFSGQAHQLVIIQDIDDRGGNIRHQLRGTVGACFQQHPSVEAGFSEPEQAVVFP